MHLKFTPSILTLAQLIDVNESMAGELGAKLNLFEKDQPYSNLLTEVIAIALEQARILSVVRADLEKMRAQHEIKANHDITG